MVSINNSAAMVGVRVLQSINKDLETTQNRLTTGNKINSAKDNASIWATAQSIKSSLSVYDRLDSTLKQEQAVFDVAAAGADQVASLLTELKAKLTYAATTSGTELANAEAEIGSLQSRLLGAVAASGVGSTNLLNTTGSRNYTTSINADGSTNTVSLTLRNVKTTDLETAVTGVTAGAAAANRYITTFDASDLMAVTGDVADMLAGIQTAIDNIGGYAGALSVASKTLDSVRSFTAIIADIKSSALDNMIGADPAEESIKLQALQVKQQLAIQSINMANSSGQNILRLFQ